MENAAGLYTSRVPESTRVSRRPSKILKRLRIVSRLIEEVTEDLSSTLRTCNLPSDLDPVLTRLRRRQRQLVHYARRLDIHLSLHESWMGENQ